MGTRLHLFWTRLHLLWTRLHLLSKTADILEAQRATPRKPKARHRANPKRHTAQNSRHIIKWPWETHQAAFFWPAPLFFRGGGSLPNLFLYSHVLHRVPRGLVFPLRVLVYHFDTSDRRTPQSTQSSPALFPVELRAKKLFGLDQLSSSETGTALD